MANSYFQFKQFIIHQDRCAMKVTTDACLFGSLSPTLSVREGVISVLDIGTGTGLLALMFAQAKQNALIDSIEIDKETFEQASENIAASPWAARVSIFHADATTFDFPNRYDIIISNPPFYENELKSGNSKRNLAHHNEGLLLPELLTIIKKNLKPDGSFFLLLPFKRNDEIRKLFIENDLAIRQLIFVRQSTKHDFFRMIISGKVKTDEVAETRIDEISIKDENDQYSSDFILLLKDYYLHL
jgi:tRNA1Val (adenine37-N6)-methyltransferase